MKYKVKEHHRYNELLGVYGEDFLEEELERRIENYEDVSNNISYYKSAGLFILSGILEHTFDARPLGLIGYVPAVYNIIKKLKADINKNNYQRLLILHQSKQKKN